MPVRPIVLYRDSGGFQPRALPDLDLRNECGITAAKAAIKDVIDSMKAANLVALAAQEIGLPLRVAAVDCEGCDPLVLINMRIIRLSTERELRNEGCASLPGVVRSVSRATEVLLSFQYLFKDIYRSTELSLGATPARAVQHIDDVQQGRLWKGLRDDRES